MSLRLLMLVHILVSSANIFMLHSIHSGTSFTKSKNRSGPKTDPCGTPLITSSQIDSCPFMMLSHSSSSLLESRELCIALTAFLRPIFLCCSWNSLRQTSSIFFSHSLYISPSPLPHVRHLSLYQPFFALLWRFHENALMQSMKHGDKYNFLKR